MSDEDRRGSLSDRIHAEMLDGSTRSSRWRWTTIASPALLRGGGRPAGPGCARAPHPYFKELFRLQGELVKMHDWIVASGHRLVILFEGRDAAGKGGAIKRITQRLNPRVGPGGGAAGAVPVARKPSGTSSATSPHLPAAGEMVLFDRSWYNRAGVERVMGFCSDQNEEFFRSVPEFEKMLVRSGIQLIKYWFSIPDEEQEFRFRCRINDPLKQWKLSPMDLGPATPVGALHQGQGNNARAHAYARRRAGFEIVEADDKRARLNCIRRPSSSRSVPRRASPSRSPCRSASTTRTTCGVRSRTRCTCPTCTESPGSITWSRT